MHSFLKYMQIYNEIEQLVILLIHGKETEWILKKNERFVVKYKLGLQHIKK